MTRRWKSALRLWSQVNALTNSGEKFIHWRAACVRGLVLVFSPDQHEGIIRRGAGSIVPADVGRERAANPPHPDKRLLPDDANEVDRELLLPFPRCTIAAFSKLPATAAWSSLSQKQAKPAASRRPF
jgi:hypothetical protein